MLRSLHYALRASVEMTGVVVGVREGIRQGQGQLRLQRQPQLQLQLQRQKQIPSLRCGMTTKKATATATARANAAISPLRAVRSGRDDRVVVGGGQRRELWLNGSSG